MKNKVKALLSSLLVAVVIAGLVIPSFAANTSDKLDYIAFGDSIAAGVRGGVGAPGSELSSDKGYTDDLAALLSAAGVLGSFNESFCTSGMTATILAQKTNMLISPDAEETRLVKDAEIATITIGANDLLGPLYAYIATLKSVNDLDTVKAKAALTEMIEGIYEGPTGKDVQNNLKKILENILAVNSSVKIYVMGYYNPLPVVSAIYGIDLNEPITYFNTFIQAAVKDILAVNTAASITYVATFDAMAASPGVLVPTDIHPTQAGHRIIAGEFWKHLEPLAGSYNETAIPSTTPIIVNGIALPFDAYSINNNNYLKLRDLAMALKQTPKRFSVAWDCATNRVNVTTGEAYTPMGGELTPAASHASFTAQVSPCVFSFNGVPISLTAYVIDNNNYIKLRDLAQALNFAVNYDPSTNSVNVDTTKEYTAPIN